MRSHGGRLSCRFASALAGSALIATRGAIPARNHLKRKMIMKAAPSLSLVLALSASAAPAQSNSELTRAAPQLVRPPLVYLCPTVPLGTKAALTSISGKLEAGQLLITLKGKCINQKPRNLGIFIVPSDQPPGAPPIGSVGSIPLESWTPGTANYRVNGLISGEQRALIPKLIVQMVVSVGTRNYSAVLSEAQANLLQIGGSVENPPVW
jgi:hypothetical protein